MERYVIHVAKMTHYSNVKVGEYLYLGKNCRLVLKEDGFWQESGGLKVKISTSQLESWYFGHGKPRVTTLH